MSSVQLFVPTEVVHNTVYELGQLGNVQYKDVFLFFLFRIADLSKPGNAVEPNINPFQHSFIAEIRHVEEMGRHICFFSSQIAKKKDVPIHSLFDSDLLLTVGPCAVQTIDDLDTTLAENEERLNKMNESYQTFNERTRELIEARQVLRETAIFFDRVCNSLDTLAFGNIVDFVFVGSRISDRNMFFV